MLLFLFITSLLSVAVFFVLYKSLQQNDIIDIESDNEYVDLYKQRKSELDAELEKQNIEKKQYHEILTSYQKQLYLDLKLNQKTKSDISFISNKPINLLIALSAPILAIGIYLLIGGGEIALQKTIPTMADLEQDPERLLIAFEEKLKTEGGNAEEWYLLAKSYRNQKRFDVALKALDEALQQEPSNIQIEADYIELLMLLNDSQPTDASTRQLLSALETNPEHPKLLWLAAIDASYKNNTEQQIIYLEKLAKQIPEDAPQRETIQKIIMATKRENSKGDIKSASSMKQLIVQVRLNKELKKYIKTDSVLFVYARANSDLPVPLAVAKLDPSNIPEKIILNDEMAMTPTMKLSNFDTVDIVALISHSGVAKSNSGDLQGSVTNISSDSKDIITIMIDSIIP